ncbi:MAG: hypothetical protein ACODAJ_10935 [Planctomycetota bacterium]
MNRGRIWKGLLAGAATLSLALTGCETTQEPPVSEPPTTAQQPGTAEEPETAEHPTKPGTAAEHPTGEHPK